MERGESFRAPTKGQIARRQLFSLTVQVIITVAVLSISFYRRYFVHGLRLRPNPFLTPLHITATIFFIPTFVLWIVARYHLAINGCFAIFAIAPPRLVTTGLYSHFRHPVYLFSTLFTASFCVMIDNVYSLIALVLIGLPVQLYRIRQEERVLRERFRGGWSDWNREKKIL